MDRWNYQSLKRGKWTSTIDDFTCSNNLHSDRGPATFDYENIYIYPAKYSTNLDLLKEPNNNNNDWLVVLAILKNDEVRQWEGWHPIYYGK